MPDTTTLADQFAGMDLVDNSGDKLGTVQSLWVDTATNQPEFVAVKTGMMGRTHIVPVAGLQPDRNGRQLRVPYTKDQINGAPHIDESAELSEQDEEMVYRHYGVQRSEAPSPTGLAGGGTDTTRMTDTSRTTDTGRTTDMDTYRDRRGTRSNRIVLHEEQLNAQKVREQAGEVQLGKRVLEREETIDVPVREERVVIERTPVQGEAHAGQITDTNETIEVPVMRERVEVEKETVATEEVNVRTEAVERTERVQDTVRKEELVVEEEGNVQVNGGNLRGTNARDTDATRNIDQRDKSRRR